MQRFGRSTRRWRAGRPLPGAGDTCRPAAAKAGAPRSPGAAFSGNMTAGPVGAGVSGGRTRRRDMATVVKGVTTVRSTAGPALGEV